MFEIAFPWALALLFLIPLIWFYDAKIKKYPAIAVPSVKPFLVPIRKRPDWVRICYYAGFALTVAALAGPRWGTERVVAKSQGIDMIFALDVSGSMETVDIPDGIDSRRELAGKLQKGELNTRLAVAKKELIKFAAGRPDDRIGLIVFGTDPYSVVPPTLDHAWLTGQMERLKAGMAGNSTGIAAPIASGIRRLKNSPAPRRVMVLFTDGRNNVNSVLSPEQTAELAGKHRIAVHTVGIGGGKMILHGGQVLKEIPENSFDEELLKQIASRSGGRYFHAADAEGMRHVMADIDKLEKTGFRQPKWMEYKEFGPKIALAALVLLMLGFAAENLWKLRIP